MITGRGGENLYNVPSADSMRTCIVYVIGVICQSHVFTVLSVHVHVQCSIKAIMLVYYYYRHFVVHSLVQVCCAATIHYTCIYNVQLRTFTFYVFHRTIYTRREMIFKVCKTRHKVRERPQT